jgi:hypothetical protein
MVDMNVKRMTGWIGAAAIVFAVLMSPPPGLAQ